MASSKKASTSSKTAHVMNLLSKNASSAAEQTASPAAVAAPAAAQPAPIPAAAPAAPVTSTAPAPPVEPATPMASAAPAAPAAASTTVSKSPILASLSSDAAVAEQIREALEDALESGEADTLSPAVEESSTVSEEQAPAPVPPPGPTKPVSPNTTCVNVMQVLVDENTERYMKMYGLCECPHCVADVKALALNNLPPKYVVMEAGHVVPRISVYEGRFQTAVTAQILRACQTVMDQPRHNRDV
jgi:pyruvate/2-oxoglutarate dehydrogenase complex dihydrolipoamide acyltransferase (E2) component